MASADHQPLSLRKVERLVKAHRDGETITEEALRKYTKVASPEYLRLYHEAFQNAAGVTLPYPAPVGQQAPRSVAKSFVLLGANGVETDLRIVRETHVVIVLQPG